MVFISNQEKYDAHYLITSIDFARRLFNYDDEVTAIEIKLKEGANINKVENEMQQLLGDRFKVLNRYEQQEETFRIMEIEKLISFILAVACFNIIGSLSMLILDKREDIETLTHLGANRSLISRIFLAEGRLISLLGALIGLVLGVLLCYLQQQFGLVKLGDGGSFLVDAYPVSVHLTDLLLILATVLLVSFVSVWYPVKRMIGG